MYHYDPEWLVQGGPPMDSFCAENDCADEEYFRLTLVYAGKQCEPNPWRVVDTSSNLVLAEGDQDEMIHYLGEAMNEMALFEEQVEEDAR